jgi:hypothetical protein
MANSNLSQAKNAKKDEFYTQYVDIQKEIEAYLEYDKNTFKNKVIYCNADDPFESNFFRYFVLNFNRLGLKRLITTSYKPSPVANTQVGLFGEDITLEPVKGRPKVTANKFIINEVSDVDGDGQFNLKDVAMQLKENKNNEWSPLREDGDFRSSECVDLLKESDVVVTNPPFSLFRDFVKQIFDHKKQFLIIGNMNSVTYKEIFPLIKSNRMWYGQSISSGDREFQVPDDYPLNAASYRTEDGKKYIRVKGVRWFTNLDHGRRHQVLDLMTMADNLKYNKKLQGHETAYVKYDNYDAIEIPYTNAIPSDYSEIMGVPITFLDKYNPDQFDILGATQRGCHDEVPDTKKYDDYWEVRQSGEKTGSSGGKTNENANLLTNDGKKNYFENSKGRIIQSAYQRIFIKHKKK